MVWVAEKGSASGGTHCGSVSSDGHTYQIYKQQRVNAPSIDGTKTFWQYKSSWGGASTKSNRKVTMGNHFNAWKSKCGSMGSYSSSYQIFALEAWGGKSGYINATIWQQVPCKSFDIAKAARYYPGSFLYISQFS